MTRPMKARWEERVSNPYLDSGIDEATWFATRLRLPGGTRAHYDGERVHAVLPDRQGGHHGNDAPSRVSLGGGGMSTERFLDTSQQQITRSLRPMSNLPPVNAFWSSGTMYDGKSTVGLIKIRISNRYLINTVMVSSDLKKTFDGSVRSTSRKDSAGKARESAIGCRHRMTRRYLVNLRLYWPKALPPMRCLFCRLQGQPEAPGNCESQLSKRWS